MDTIYHVVRGEVAILVEEKIRLCEKVGALAESCSLKDRSYEYPNLLSINS